MPAVLLWRVAPVVPACGLWFVETGEVDLLSLKGFVQSLPTLNPRALVAGG